MKFQLMFLVVIFLALCMESNGVAVDPKTMCHLPDDAGTCLAMIQRFYYNAEKRECERFYYGGCPNIHANTFKTKEECDKFCVACTKPANPGKCRAMVHRFYYNAEKKQCERHYYGGCPNIHRNDFKTKEECENSCAVA